MIYKNISELEQTVPGVGVVKPQEEVEITGEFNNANFILVKKTSPNKNKKVEGEELEESK